MWYLRGRIDLQTLVVLSTMAGISTSIEPPNRRHSFTYRRSLTTLKSLRKDERVVVSLRARVTGEDSSFGTAARNFE